MERQELLAERGKYRKGKRIQKGWRQIACWEIGGLGGGLEKHFVDSCIFENTQKENAGS